MGTNITEPQKAGDFLKSLITIKRLHHSDGSGAAFWTRYQKYDQLATNIQADEFINEQCHYISQSLNILGSQSPLTSQFFEVFKIHPDRWPITDAWLRTAIS